MEALAPAALALPVRAVEQALHQTMAVDRRDLINARPAFQKDQAELAPLVATLVSVPVDRMASQ